MKTLADLKRDLKIGTMLTLTQSFFPGHKFLNVPRYVVKNNSVGIELNANKEAKSGSCLNLKRASLIKYDGTTLKIFDPAERPLTAEEQTILNGLPSMQPKNKELCEHDLISDGSTTFFMDKKYLMDKNAGWYWKEAQGKYYHKNDNTMTDYTIKGKLLLQYSKGATL